MTTLDTSVRAGMDWMAAGSSELLSAPEIWGATRNATLVCRRVHQITPDVAAFLFASDQPALFAHRPGQFITLQVQIDGRPVRRCYTISSPPTRPHLLAITVKRQPGGLVSNWLHDTMAPGHPLTAEGPFGIFSMTHHPAPMYLFLSGGSGITPMLSMARTLYDLGSDADVVFIHSARTPADIICRRELALMAATAPNLRVVHICEDDSAGEAWEGLQGRLSAALLEHLVPDVREREVFCCGPGPYMAAVRRLLDHVGCDQRRYHEESFAFEDLPAYAASKSSGTMAPSHEHDRAVTTFTVEFVRSGQSFPCAADQYVLDAAYAAGLTPLSSCTQGMCGTCKTTMLSGSVDMQHNGGIRPREIAANKVLICCSKPLSDLAIDS